VGKDIMNSRRISNKKHIPISLNKLNSTLTNRTLRDINNSGKPILTPIVESKHTGNDKGYKMYINTNSSRNKTSIYN
jgi:hypothetical protein